MHQNLVDIESVVGSGPALWLWLDASAPSTTVQLQVLERMLADPASQRVVRGMTWVVADAGTDFEAFERLTQHLAERYGGLNRMPFELLHTGGTSGGPRRLNCLRCRWSGSSGQTGCRCLRSCPCPARSSAAGSPSGHEPGDVAKGPRFQCRNLISRRPSHCCDAFLCLGHEVTGPVPSGKVIRNQEVTFMSPSPGP